jgi:phosphoribosyl 1,2-cyclic phosphate phosphodiesterase
MVASAIAGNTMSKFQAIFLGTGTSQGVPVISCNCKVCSSSNQKDKRLRTSLLLKLNATTIVIDTGPDFRQQMLQNQVKMVDAVLFTHEHKDHISGMDDIRAYNYVSKKAMPIYATKRVQEALKREYHYVFSNYTYPGIPQVDLFDITDEPLNLFGETIIPINVMHYELPVKAFRIRGLTYITDANFISENEIKKIVGSEILIVNALRNEPHISHFNLEEALELIERINPKKAYLTHISHLLGDHETVIKSLPENVFLAYDGLKINFE